MRKVQTSGNCLCVEEELFDIDTEKLWVKELKKVPIIQEKFDKQHTVWLLLSAKPCGVVSHIGCDSMSEEKIYVSEMNNCKFD